MLQKIHKGLLLPLKALCADFIKLYIELTKEVFNSIHFHLGTMCAVIDPGDTISSSSCYLLTAIDSTQFIKLMCPHHFTCITKQYPTQKPQQTCFMSVQLIVTLSSICLVPRDLRNVCAIPQQHFCSSKWLQHCLLHLNACCYGFDDGIKAAKFRADIPGSMEVSKTRAILWTKLRPSAWNLVLGRTMLSWASVGPSGMKVVPRVETKWCSVCPVQRYETKGHVHVERRRQKSIKSRPTLMTT